MTDRDPENEPLDELDAEVVEDLDVDDDAEDVRAGRNETFNWHCMPT